MWFNRYINQKKGIMNTNTTELTNAFNLYLGLALAGIFILLIVTIAIVYAILKSSDELTKIRKIAEKWEQKEISR